MKGARDRRLRQLLEKAGVAATLRQRRQSIVKKMAKVNAECDGGRITVMLDDVASILGLPRDHPKVLAGTAYALAREDKNDQNDKGSEYDRDWGDYPRFEF